MKDSTMRETTKSPNVAIKSKISVDRCYSRIITDRLKISAIVWNQLKGKDEAVLHQYCRVKEIQCQSQQQLDRRSKVKDPSRQHLVQSRAFRKPLWFFQKRRRRRLSGHELDPKILEFRYFPRSINDFGISILRG